MTARIINGTACAQSLQETLKEKVAALWTSHSIRPSLAVIRVGDDPASEIYVRRKKEHSASIGIQSQEIHLNAYVSQETIINEIKRLNKDPKIHGILVQLPLPPLMNPDEVLMTIDPTKDVDGLHVVNLGQLIGGNLPLLLPCTPQGCIKLLKQELDTLKGLKALMVGRSRIVGMPLSLLLIRESCTVTVAHASTENLAKECSQADILIAAIGKPNFIKGDWIKPGAVVIDVGINRSNSESKHPKIIGDVDFEQAKHHARAITPVPGGVGPMTIACLLMNTVKAFCHQQGILYDLS